MDELNYLTIFYRFQSEIQYIYVLAIYEYTDTSYTQYFKRNMYIIHTVS